MKGIELWNILGAVVFGAIGIFVFVACIAAAIFALYPEEGDE